MSKEMVQLAWEAEVATSAMKCILVALADHHNINSGQCNPSIKRLVNRTCMNKQAVINNIRKLVAIGLVSVKRDAGTGRGRRSNNYTLNLKDKIDQKLVHLC